VKLASLSHLKAVTGESDPRAQLQVLNELGINAIYKHGRVRVYEEVIARAMLSPANNKKPKLNL